MAQFETPARRKRRVISVRRFEFLDRMVGAYETNDRFRRSQFPRAKVRAWDRSPDIAWTCPERWTHSRSDVSSVRRYHSSLLTIESSAVAIGTSRVLVVPIFS